MDYSGRIRRLRGRLEEEKLDALLVTSLPNIRYLCGFTGSNAQVLINSDECLFLTDGRYRTQSEQEVTGAEIRVYAMSNELKDELVKAVSRAGTSRVGYEGAHVTVNRLGQFQEWFEGLDLQPMDSLVESLRRVKDSDEMELIRRSAKLADEALEHIKGKVRAGATEKELALELEFFIRSAADGASFEPIVAAGERSALPHAMPTDRKVKKGDLLLFDLGSISEGYCSDLTRTVVVGEPNRKVAEVYEVVRLANEAGIAALGPEVSCKSPDIAARDIIVQAGFGDAFSHSLGHGVGLEVHEAPGLRRTATDHLMAGDVVTIEPGIYLPGWGGVRIEDLVAVNDSGYEVLSHSPKELLVL